MNLRHEHTIYCFDKARCSWIILGHFMTSDVSTAQFGQINGNRNFQHKLLLLNIFLLYLNHTRHKLYKFESCAACATDPAINTVTRVISIFYSAIFWKPLLKSLELIQPWAETWHWVWGTKNFLDLIHFFTKKISISRLKISDDLF